MVPRRPPTIHTTILAPAALAGGITLALGGLVAVGWLLGIERLTYWLPGWTHMKPGTAVGLSLVGLALLVGLDGAGSARPRLGRACAALAALVGGFTLLTYGVELRVPGLEWLPVNRMAPTTAVSFILVGAALWAHGLAQPPARYLAQALTLVALFIAGIALIGYLYGVPALYQLGAYTPMAPHTVVAFLAACAGSLLWRPTEGLLAEFAGDSAGARSARRLLVAIVVLPVLMGWLRLAIQRRGPVSPEFGQAVVVVSNMLVLTIVTWFNARSLNRADRRRQAAEQALTQANDELEQRVRARTAQLSEAQTLARLGSWSWEVATDRVQWSDELYRIFGLAPHAITVSRATYLDFVHPDDRTLMEAQLQAALDTRTGFNLDTRIVRPNGETRYLHARGEVVVDAAGAAAAIIGTAQDVTDQRQAEAALRQSEARYRYLVDNADDLIYETDAAGRIAAFNPMGVRLLQYTAQELRGRHYLEFVQPDYQRRVKRAYRRQFTRGVRTTYEEFPVVAKDGSEIWLGQNAQLILDGDRPVGFQVVARDITRRRQAEQALQAANQKLTTWVTELEQRNREISLLSHMGELLQACQAPADSYSVFAQISGQLFPAHTGALYVFNASRDRLECMVQWGQAGHLAAMFAPDACWAVRRGQPHHRRGSQLALHCQHVGADEPADTLCIPMTAQSDSVGLLHLRSGTAGGLAGAEQVLAITVAEQMALALSNLRLRETLRSQAIRDPLTGLFNRRYMEETLERELQRAARDEKPFAVIMLDLDHFKRFNDTYGHPAGDAVLRQMGALLDGHIRGADIACRYGGEEFTLIMPDCPIEAACQRAEALRRAARQLTVQHLDQTLGGLSLSIGIAGFPQHGAAGTALLSMADRALYQAKQAGRDRVVVAPPNAH